MPSLLAALFFFAILTLWVSAWWPVAVFEVGICALTAAALLRARRSPFPFTFPLVPLTFAPAWGVFQWLTGRTVYSFDTRSAIAHWTAFLAVFLCAFLLFRDAPVRRWFRRDAVVRFPALDPRHPPDLHLQRQGLLAFPVGLHRLRHGPVPLPQPLRRLHRGRAAHRLV